MKNLIRYLGVLTIGLATAAYGLTIVGPDPIDPSQGNPNLADPMPIAWGNETGTPKILEGIKALGINLGTEQYKSDVGKTAEQPTVDSGPLASSYTTTFANTQLDPSDFKIEYQTGEAFVSGSPIYLLVKDGNQKPAWYLYDITGWNGTDAIVGTGFWSGSGGISHVAIYVPDGGLTILLLGAAMAGLGFANRKLRKA